MQYSINFVLQETLIINLASVILDHKTIFGRTPKRLVLQKESTRVDVNLHFLISKPTRESGGSVGRKNDEDSKGSDARIGLCLSSLDKTSEEVLEFEF